METEVFTETVAPSDLQAAELPPEALEERTDVEQLDSGYCVRHNCLREAFVELLGSADHGILKQYPYIFCMLTGLSFLMLVCLSCSPTSNWQALYSSL